MAHPPLTVQHVALHLAKYAGELASIAEQLDHADPVKKEKGRRLAKRFLDGRQYAIVWCVDNAETVLREALA